MQTRNVVRYLQTRDEVRTKATGVTTVSYSYPSEGRDRFTVISDVKNGDRKTVNPHEFTKRPFSDYCGSYTRDNPVETLNRSGVIGGFANYIPSSPLLSNLYNQAIAEMYEKLRSGDVGSGLDLSIDALQYRQVGEMADNLLRIRPHQITLEQDLRRIRRNGSTRTIAEAWLTFQYGIKPLVQSIYGTFDALMNRQTNSACRITGFGRDVRETQRSYTNGFWPGSREVVHTRERYRCKVECLFTLENSLAQRLSGYTSLNPASMLWETMRGSFVVDWAYDVGGYLRNLESGVLFRQGFKEGYVVYGGKSDNSGMLFGVGGNPLTIGQHSGDARAYFNDRFKRRSKISIYPLPYPPQFQLRMGLSRFMSAASLLRVNMPR